MRNWYGYVLVIGWDDIGVMGICDVVWGIVCGWDRYIVVFLFVC